MPKVKGDMNKTSTEMIPMTSLFISSDIHYIILPRFCYPRQIFIIRLKY